VLKLLLVSTSVFDFPYKLKATVKKLDFPHVAKEAAAVAQEVSVVVLFVILFAMTLENQLCMHSLIALDVAFAVIGVVFLSLVRSGARLTSVSTPGGWHAPSPSPSLMLACSPSTSSLFPNRCVSFPTFPPSAPGSPPTPPASAHHRRASPLPDATRRAAPLRKAACPLNGASCHEHAVASSRWGTSYGSTSSFVSSPPPPHHPFPCASSTSDDGSIDDTKQTALLHRRSSSQGPLTLCDRRRRSDPHALSSSGAAPVAAPPQEGGCRAAVSPSQLFVADDTESIDGSSAPCDTSLAEGSVSVASPLLNAPPIAAPPPPPPHPPPASRAGDTLDPPGNVLAKHFSSADSCGSSAGGASASGARWTVTALLARLVRARSEAPHLPPMLSPVVTSPTFTTPTPPPASSLTSPQQLYPGAHVRFSPAMMASLLPPAGFWAALVRFGVPQAILVAFFLLCMSPVLSTLTNQYSNDTIAFLTFLLLAVRIYSFDYAFVNGYRERFRRTRALLHIVHTSHGKWRQVSYTRP